MAAQRALPENLPDIWNSLGDVPEAGRAEAGTWKNCISISTIPAQRAGLQGCPSASAFSLTEWQSVSPTENSFL
jgi:hypothetical protein